VFACFTLLSSAKQTSQHVKQNIRYRYDVSIVVTVRWKPNCLCYWIWRPSTRRMSDRVNVSAF